MTTNRALLVIGSLIVIVILLFVILSDGGGGPVIVIKPPPDGLVTAARAPTWSVTCRGKPPQPVPPTDPPTIPGRWLHRHGIEKIYVWKKDNTKMEVDVVSLEIDDGGATQTLTVRKMDDGAPEWTFAGKPVESNGKGRRSWPEDMLGTVKTVNSLGVDDIERIEIYHNKQWGFPWCN